MEQDWIPHVHKGLKARPQLQRRRQDVTNKAFAACRGKQALNGASSTDRALPKPTGSKTMLILAPDVRQVPSRFSVCPSRFQSCFGLIVPWQSPAPLFLWDVCSVTLPTRICAACFYNLQWLTVKSLLETLDSLGMLRMWSL